MMMTRMVTMITSWLLVALLSWRCAHAAVVVNTWPWTAATTAAFEAMQHATPSSKTALNAIAAGCHQCEVDQCDFTVGYGGSPDSTGETTLDAMILDGDTLRMGAVASLPRVQAAIHVARAVMDHSAHSILAGNGALRFAKMMGFQEESLETAHSREMHQQWLAAHCQPNYFRNVVAQDSSCPPYKPLGSLDTSAWTSARNLITHDNHDTIGMVAIDDGGHMAAGTSSNGANHKIAGRVGDAAIPGAGAYVDSNIGGAAATGDGDVMMLYLPSLLAVQAMGRGLHPREACEHALLQVARGFPDFKGGMVCLNRMGEHGGAGHGWRFSYSVQETGMKTPLIIKVAPLALE